MAINIDIDRVVPIYQDGIDALIDSLGKPVRLFFKDSVDNVNTEYDDQVRPGNTRKPAWKETSTNNAPNVTENYRDITALIQHNPSDLDRFNINVEKPEDTLRLKCFLKDVPDLTRAEYIIPNHDDVKAIYAKYKILRQPVPIGLNENRYALSFWQRI